jgi:hypothetical protein
MPNQVLLVATPAKVRAFAAAIEGSEISLGDEVTSWERRLLFVRTEQRLGMTMLTLESPSRDRAMTVAPLGTEDDAVGLEFGAELIGDQAS